MIQFVLSVGYVPGTETKTLHTLFHLILTSTLDGGVINIPLQMTKVKPRQVS